MEMALIQRIMPSNVNSEEKRSPAASEEGCSGEFGLVLQSLMSLQVAGSGGTSDDKGNEVLSSASSKAMAAALKIPLHLPGYQISEDMASHQLVKVLQDHISQVQSMHFSDQALPEQLSSEQILSELMFSMPEEAHGVEAVPYQNVTALLHSANGIQEFHGKAQGQIFNVVYNVSTGDVEPTVKESSALNTLARGEKSYTSEIVAGIKEDVGLKKDGTAKSSYSDPLEGVTAQPRGSPITLKADVERPSDEPMALHVEYIEQGIYRDAAALDEGKEEFQFDLNQAQEGHALEHLYADGQLQQASNDEVSNVHGQRALNFNEVLADIADRVRVLLSDKRSEMEVLLKPPELGKMVIKVAIEDGTLQVRITVNSNAVKDFLQSHVQELKAMLVQKGYSFANIDVNIGQDYQQPQHNGMGNGWHLEKPIRRVRPDMAELQRSIISPAGYYNGHHRFDCFA